MSDMLRITGLASGMDTDEMVAKLVAAEKTRITPYEQKKQTLEWQKDMYRDVSSVLMGFKTSNFDLLNLDNDFRRASTFNVFSGGVTLNGAATSYVSINAAASTSAGSIAIQNIQQLATADKWKSSGAVSTTMTSTPNIADLNTQITAGNDTLKFTLDGVEKSITLAGGYGSLTDFVNDLDTKLAAEFTSVSITATENGGNLELSLGEAGHTLSLSSSSEDLMTAVGFSNGASNVVQLGDTLAERFNIGADQQVTINGVDFTFQSTDTVGDMINEINGSAAGVTLSYSEVTDTFTLQSNTTGEINNIELTDTSSFFAGSLKLDGTNRTAGQDAILTIDNVLTSRATNSFVANGVSITLEATYDGTSGEITATTSNDVDGVVDKIKSFVENYNKVLDKLNTLIKEERFYDYKPLTEDQKKELSDDEIEDWEEKAKSGLLRSDTLLRSIQSNLRNALIDTVDGATITFNDIGIQSSSDITQGGKLVIDENRLRDALETRGSEVVTLFTKESTTAYNDSANRATRYSENGLSYRLFDALEDAVRTSRVDGRKGSLLEKAGIVGDASVINNTLTLEINEYKIKIEDMLLDLADKEDYYYTMFGKMESALSQMMAQSSLFSQGA